MNARKVLHVTADSSANQKILKRLQREGYIKIHFVNMENAMENPIIKDKVPAGFTIGVSLIGGEDVIVDDDSANIYKQVRDLIGKYNYQDARQLEAHFRSGNDVFISGDKDDILNHKKKLKNMGITVMSPEELEKCVKAV